MDPISFISEHTAEYILVPQLVEGLSAHFSNVVPFYFWSSREGNSISRQCHPRRKIRLLSVFARRPKITQPFDSQVSMKLNTELFDLAHSSNAFGIPVLAGIPVISSIWDATLEAPCQWYRLEPTPEHIPDVQFTVPSDGVFEGTFPPNAVTGPMTMNDIVTLVREVTQPMTWDEGIRSLRELRLTARAAHNHVWHFGGYKPFNIMVTES